MPGLRKLKLPVLMYHAVRSDKSRFEGLSAGQDIYTVPREDFVHQIDWLRVKGFTCPTASDLARRSGFLGNVRGIVVLTFDDGYVSDYDEVLPLLKSRGMKATHFVTIEFIGRRGYMDWRMARELADNGHEIGSHGLTHRYPSEIRTADLEKELVWSRKIIEDKVGKRVRAFSLPGGKGGMRVCRLARDAGYRIVCTSAVGASIVHDGIMDLKRIYVNRGTGMREFEAMVGFEQHAMLKRKVLTSSKRLASRILGNRTYDAVREKILGRLSHD